MVRRGGGYTVAHVVGGGEDELGSLRHHVIDHGLQRGLRTIGSVDLVQHDHRVGGQPELLDDVETGLVVRLRPTLIVLRSDQDHSELESLSAAAAVVVTACRDDERGGQQQSQ